MHSAKIRAAAVMERCDRLAEQSEEAGAITRPYGSRAMRRANELVSRWMRAAGMAVRRDAIGNLIGRYEGCGEKTLLLGSHLDTVRDAGRYDGALGVLVAIACVEGLHGERLPYSIEVVAFADEEGLRFGTTLMGSSVYAGGFDPAFLALEDAGGVTLERAIRDFGGDPGALEDAARVSDDLLGYCEVHIEQGPVLDREDLPVGVVGAIGGQSRLRVAFTGEAGHAGTVPMDLRRDALCAAAAFVLEVEAAARAEPGAVATVGEISAHPGASNVIPAHVEHSLDVRHPEDAARERLRDRLAGRASEIAAARGCTHRLLAQGETPAVATDPHLSALLEEAVEAAGLRARRLVSGAGHDAARVAALTPMAMLFVRCAGGVSHHPDESVERGSVEAAIGVMERFLVALAGPAGTQTPGRREGA